MLVLFVSTIVDVPDHLVHFSATLSPQVPKLQVRDRRVVLAHVQKCTNPLNFDCVTLPKVDHAQRTIGDQVFAQSTNKVGVDRIVAVPTGRADGQMNGKTDGWRGQRKEGRIIRRRIRRKEGEKEGRYKGKNQGMHKGGVQGRTAGVKKKGQGRK